MMKPDSPISLRPLLLLPLLALAVCFAPLAPAADLTITAASVLGSANATYERGTAGATVTAGQVVYKDSATNTYKLARANAGSTSSPRGIAAHGASSGQPLSVITSDPGFTIGATSSAGILLALSSATAGGIAPSGDLTTGGYPFIFGIVLNGGTTASINFLTPFATGAALP